LRAAQKRTSPIDVAQTKVCPLIHAIVRRDVENHCVWQREVLLKVVISGSRSTALIVETDSGGELDKAFLFYDGLRHGCVQRGAF
jgi:hypothetical protein